MLDEMEHNDWNSAENCAFLAFEMYETGQMQLALSQLLEAIEINPNNATYHPINTLTCSGIFCLAAAVMPVLRKSISLQSLKAV